MKIYFQKHNLNNYQIYPEPQDKANWIAQDINESELESHVLVEFNGNYQWVKKSADPMTKWNGKQWVVDEEKMTAHLAQVRAEMREKINALRDEKINGGVFVEAVGKWIDTDATAERNILSVKASFDLFGDQLGDIAWTCADNSVLMIDKAKLMQIWQALMQAKTGSHANALRHKTAVEQSDNPLDYDYSDGWTRCYQDYVAEQGNE